MAMRGPAGEACGQAPRREAGSPASSALVAQRLVRDPLAAADRVMRLGPAADVEDVDAGAAVDAPAAEVGLDPVVASARTDPVPAVAGVEEVRPGTAGEAVALARRLAGVL